MAYITHKGLKLANQKNGKFWLFGRKITKEATPNQQVESAWAVFLYVVSLHVYSVSKRRSLIVSYNCFIIEEKYVFYFRCKLSPEHL